MGPVATTFTLVDSQMEHKKLRDDIALLKQEKEIAERDMKQAIEAREAIYQAHQSNVVLSEVKDEALEIYRDKIRADTQKLRVEHDILEKAGIIYFENKKALEGEIEKNSALLEAGRQSLANLNATVEAEVRILNDFRITKATEEDNFNNRLVCLKKDVDALTADKEAFESDFQRKRIEIMEDEQRLAVKQSDLEIYEIRIRAKAAEIDPLMQIIL